MIAENVLKRIVWEIHQCQDLAGCTVGYYGDNACRTIGYPSCVTSNSENVAVIVEEVVLQLGSASPPATSRSAGAPQLDPKFVANKTKIWPELIGAGASCTLTVFSTLGVMGGVAGEMPTGGASTFLLVASWGGMITGGIQCANGLVRVGHLITNWDTDSLAHWDENDTYNTAIFYVDVIGVAGSIASLPYQARNLWAVVTRLRSLNANAQLSLEALKRMNRVERFQTIARVFHQASRTPEGAQALVAAARELKIGAQTLQASRVSVNNARLLTRIIREETVKRLSASLKDVLGGISGVVLSGTSSAQTGSGSGSVNKGITYLVSLVDAGAPNF
jgi:hypothetical protein